jgi:hypothetical protein
LGISYSLLSVKDLKTSYECVVTTTPVELYPEPIPIEFWTYQAAKNYLEACRKQKFDLSADKSLKEDIQSVTEILKKIELASKNVGNIEKGPLTYKVKDKCPRCER